MPPTFYDFALADVLFSRPCESTRCGTMLHFIQSPSRPGGRIPLDVTAEGCWMATRERAGRGVSHFTTCPDPGRFSRRRAQGGKR